MSPDLRLRHKGLSSIPFKPILRDYYKVASDFVYYLDNTERLKLQIDGIRYSTHQGEVDVDAIRKLNPYIHRWTEPYLKSRIAKGYLLDEWYREMQLPVTMLTYTTYHDYLTHKKARPVKVNDGYTIESTFDILKTGFNRSRNMIRKIKGCSVPFLCMYEPHPDSGYPHIHCLTFSDFDQGEMHRLKTHWSAKLSAGDYEHGLDFEEGTSFKSGELDSVKNYMLKYMAKTLYDGWKEWTAEELVFNAVAWKNHYRTFQPSHDLSRVMARKDVHQGGYVWIKTSVVGLGANLPVEASVRATDSSVNRDAWINLYCGD